MRLRSGLRSSLDFDGSRKADRSADIADPGFSTVYHRRKSTLYRIEGAIDAPAGSFQGGTGLELSFT